MSVAVKLARELIKVYACGSGEYFLVSYDVQRERGDLSFTNRYSARNRVTVLIVHQHNYHEIFNGI